MTRFFFFISFDIPYENDNNVRPFFVSLQPKFC